MAKGLIPREFITQILGQVDIVQIMREHGIELKSSGRGEFKACCPFHSERTPSFYVNQHKQIYNCFGCKASGNIINFLQEYNKFSFIDSIEYIAERLGLEIPYEHSSNRNENSINYVEYYNKMNECAELYTRCINNSKMPQGLNYFLNRGISIETINRFRLGLAPDMWDFLSKYAVNAQKDKDIQLLTDLGLVKKKENGTTFDIFRNRVMIPILDRRGRVVAFGGRVLNDDKPKYLNSPEMVIFHKGRELFGLYQAIEASKANQGKIPLLVIVEGYMDVIALSQAGFDYSVASLGTSTTIDQFDLLFRYTKKVVCCYDGDAAGQRAAWHALQVMLPTIKDDCDVRFAFLPVEHDPDSFVREFGKDGFEEYLANALPLDEYVFDYLKKNLISENSKRELINNCIELLALLPENLRLEELLSRLANTVFEDRENLRREWNKRRKNKAKPSFSFQNTNENNLELNPIRRAFALTIQYPKSVLLNVPTIENILNMLKKFNDILGIEYYEQLFNFIVQYEKHNATVPGISTACILNAYSGGKFEKSAQKLARAEVYGRASNINLESVCADICATLSKVVLEKYMNIVEKLQNESMKRTLTQEELIELSDKIRFIKQFSGRIITTEN